MISASCKRLLFLHFCWSLIMTSDNFNEGNVLRISCGVINAASDNPIQMSIYEDTPSNTLVSMVYKTCPNVQDSGSDKHIHLTECVPNGETMPLEIVLGNYNPTGSKHFGCNYMYLVGESQTSNSVPLATVGSPEKSSPAASIEKSSPAASIETESTAAPEGRPEVTEGTPPSTVRDDTSTDDHAGTCGRHDTWSLVVSTFNCALLLIIVYKVCWNNTSKLNCSCLCSCGKTAQEKSKKSEHSKHDELEDTYGYTTISKARKRDDYGEGIEVNEPNSPPDNVNEMAVQLKSANSSLEDVSGMEEYQNDNPYTQETCVINFD